MHKDDLIRIVFINGQSIPITIAEQYDHKVKIKIKYEMNSNMCYVLLFFVLLPC